MNQVGGELARGRGGQAHELEHQRFGQVGGGNAGRVESLQQVEGVLQVVFVKHPVQRGIVDDVFEAVGEVTLFVEKVDEDMDVRRFFFGERMLADLFVQVGVEIFFGGDIEPRVFRIVAAYLAPARQGGRNFAVEIRVGEFFGFVAFEQGIVLKPVFHFALDFQAGHLQYAQRLLQALVELLGLFEFQAEVLGHVVSTFCYCLFSGSPCCSDAAASL